MANPKNERKNERRKETEEGTEKNRGRAKKKGKRRKKERQPIYSPNSTHKDRLPGVSNKDITRQASYTLTCFFAVPIVVLFTLVANFSDVTVSLRCAIMGETITNMRHLLFPPSEYWSR